MNRHHARHFAAILLLAFVACASPPRSGSPTSSNRTMLASDEMQKAGYPDVYTTVQTLRPQWLQLRGQTRFRATGQIKVYMDGSLLGGPEFLKQITTKSISDIRYMDALEASQRWGFDHDMGAIVVTTRRN